MVWITPYAFLNDILSIIAAILEGDGGDEGEKDDKDGPLQKLISKLLGDRGTVNVLPEVRLQNQLNWTRTSPSKMS